MFDNILYDFSITSSKTRCYLIITKFSEFSETSALLVAYILVLCDKEVFLKFFQFLIGNNYVLLQNQ